MKLVVFMIMNIAISYNQDDGWKQNGSLTLKHCYLDNMVCWQRYISTNIYKSSRCICTSYANNYSNKNMTKICRELQNLQFQGVDDTTHLQFLLHLQNKPKIHDDLFVITIDFINADLYYGDRQMTCQQVCTEFITQGLKEYDHNIRLKTKTRRKRKRKNSKYNN